MEKKLLKKIVVVSVIFLLIGLGLSPVASSKKTNEKSQHDDIVLNQFSLETDENKVFSLNEKEFDLLKNLISYIIQNIASEKNANDNWIDSIISLDKTDNPLLNGIINLILNALQNKNDGTIFSKKTIVISQGWSYNFNYFKNSKFEIKRNSYSFWHYTHGSKTGGESKTLIIKPDRLFFSKSAEIFKGKQIGFMYQPTGIYIYQKNNFPKPCYTLFIGFANFANAIASEEIELNLPLT